MKCHSCGAKLPAGARFCHECGDKQGLSRQPIFSEKEIAEIQKEARPDDYMSRLKRTVHEGLAVEQRDVAVLFVDVSSSTPMFTALGSDQVREVFRDVYSVMSGAITRCGGYVDKFIGDEVMAIFGAPISLERPCERAITAGDEISIGLAAVNQRFKFLLPSPLSIHAGIAFGNVQAGRLGDSMKLEYSFLGETVNLANRLTDAAPAGTVLVDRQVQARACEAFEFEDMGALALPGIGHPVKAFKLTGPRGPIMQWPRFSKLGAPMFGRDKEFGELKEVFDKLASCYPDPEPCETGQGKYNQLSRIIGIIGEAGVGKTRLKREFRNHLRQDLGEDGFRWLAGGAWTIGQTPLYWPIKMQIASALGFDLTTSSDKIAEALSTVAEGPGDDAHLISYLYRLFGLQYPDSPLSALEPEAIRENLWLATRRLYARWSEQGPLVLVFEDMHWADGGTIDFLDYLSGFVGDFPVMVLLLYRPDFRPGFADIENVPFTEIGLGPLSSDAESTLFDSYIHSGQKEQAFLRQLRHYSEGNPLFVEEFLLMLLEQGKLNADGMKMRLAKNIERIDPPTGLAEVLGARFDRLSQRDRRVAYYAALIGRRFPYSLLSYVHNSLHGEADVSGSLESLLAREIIFRRGSEPEPEYFFKHAITREILVSRLMEGLKRELSRLIAARVEERYEDRIDEFHGMLSDHWETAGETERAARHAALWGIYNEKQERNFEAQDAFEKYDRLCERLPCSPLSPHEEGRLLASRINALQDLGRREEAIDFCEALSGLGDGKWRSIALRKEARVMEQMGDWDRSLSLAEQALAASQQVGDRETEAEAVRMIGIVNEQRGDWDQAFRCFTESLELHRKSGNRLGMASSLVSIGIVHYRHGAYDQALRCCNEALEIGRELGDRSKIASALLNLGTVYEQRGDYDEALRYYNEVLEMHRDSGDTGDRNVASIALHNIGNVHKDRGDYEHALGYYDEALSMFRELEHRHQAAFSLHDIGQIHCCRGNYDQALQYLEEALALFDELGDRPCIGSSLNGIAGVRAATGNWKESRKVALQAEEINRSIDSRPSLSDSLSVLCRADAAMGNWAGSLEFGIEAKSIADAIEQKEQMINCRLALSEAHLRMVRSYSEGKRGASLLLPPDDARREAIGYAKEAKSIAESREMKGHAQEASKLLASIEGA